MSKLTKDLSLGISTTFEAVSFVFKNGVLWYYLFPILLNVVIWVSGAFAVDMLMDWLNAKMDAFIGGEPSDLDQVQGIWNSIVAMLQNALIGANDFIKLMLMIMVKVLVGLLFAVFGGYLVIILMSPALAYISEHVEKVVKGSDYPLDWEQIMRDVVRGVLIALRNMFYQMLWTLGFMILGFIPVVNLIAPFGIFIVGSYYYGYSFMDYVNERKKLNVSESNNIIKDRKGIAIANGLPLSLVLLIPIVGSFIGTFVAVNCTVAASLAMLKRDDQDTQWKLQASNAN